MADNHKHPAHIQSLKRKLEESPDEVDINEFQALLDADAVSVRVEAAELLVQLVEARPAALTDAIPLLFGRLKKSEASLDYDEVIHCVESLARIGTEHTGPLWDLRNSGSWGDDSDLQSMANALSYSQEKSFLVEPLLPILIDQLNHESRDIKEAAAFELTYAAHQSPPPDFPDLQPIRDFILAADKDLRKRTRRQAIRALGGLVSGAPDQTEEIIDSLTTELESGSQTRRRRASLAFAHAADWIDKMIDNVIDESLPDEKRGGNLEGLLPAIPALTEALQDDDSVTRNRAASALGFIASQYPEQVRPAISGLTSALEADLETDPEGFKNISRGYQAIKPLGIMAADDPSAVAPATDVLIRVVLNVGDGPGQQAAFTLINIAEHDPEPLRPAEDAFCSLVVDEDRNTTTRVYISAVLVMLNDERGLDVLKQIREDSSASERPRKLARHFITQLE